MAIKLYSDGIAIDGSNHVLYSNRAAAKSGAKDYQGALEDAEKVCLPFYIEDEAAVDRGKGGRRNAW